VEGPVPLNDVGPPAVPLGLPPCANAKVPDTANAEANTIVVSFMADSFLFERKIDRKAGEQCCVDRTRRLLQREAIMGRGFRRVALDQIDVRQAV
jgi:hypothetical protein